MNRLFAAAATVLDFCDRRGWRSCVIGGIAVQRWGEPRQTRDVDVSLLTGYGGEAETIERLLETFPGRIQTARSFALEHRVLLVATSDGVPIDISLAALPYEARVVDRASPFVVDPALTIRTCSAEDLVVLKAFAGRPQDWLDVESVIVRRGEALDRELVRTELTPLLQAAEDATSEERLRQLFSKHG